MSPDLVTLTESKSIILVRYTQLIQVCLKLTRDNLKRELDGLYEAMEFFKIKQGLIITLEQEDQFMENDLEVVVKPYHQWESQLNSSVKSHQKHSRKA